MRQRSRSRDQAWLDSFAACDDCRATLAEQLELLRCLSDRTTPPQNQFLPADRLPELNTSSCALRHSPYWSWYAINPTKYHERLIGDTQFLFQDVIVDRETVRRNPKKLN